MYFTCKGRYVYHSNFSYFRAYFVFVFLFIRQVKYCSVFILPLKFMSHVPTFPKYPYKSSLLKTISLIKFIATTSRKDSFTRMMVTNQIFGKPRLIMWCKRTTFLKVSLFTTGYFSGKVWDNIDQGNRSFCPTHSWV